MKSKLFLLGLCFIIAFNVLGKGKYDYIPPTSTPPSTENNYFIANTGKDEVWNKIIFLLNSKFIPINIAQKDIGMINFNLIGDPEEYLDCGQISSFVKNLRGPRTYNFPASRAHQQYEVMVKTDYYLMTRSMELQESVNLIVEVVDADHTKISVNIRYIVTKTVYGMDVLGHDNISSDACSFTSGQIGQFQFTSVDLCTTCQPNGKLEKKILDMFQSSLT